MITWTSMAALLATGTLICVAWCCYRVHRRQVNRERSIHKLSGRYFFCFSCTLSFHKQKLNNRFTRVLLELFLISIILFLVNYKLCIKEWFMLVIIDTFRGQTKTQQRFLMNLYLIQRYLFWKTAIEFLYFYA